MPPSIAPTPSRSKDAAFYRSYAKPERGPVQSSEAGRWVLETDRKTRLAYPRLISLTGGASVTKANAALEAIHGRLDKTALKYHRELMEIPLFREGGIEVDDVLWLKPKATYLSPRFLAVAAIGGRKSEGNATPIHALGAGVDIRQGTIFSVASCQDSREGPYFTFGSLLTICDDGKLEAFRALWREQARIVQVTAPHRETTGPNYMYEDCRGLATSFTNVIPHFSVYPTPRGLAVHSVASAGGWEEVCLLDPDSPFFPAIIPWARLAPLMSPGPWRDELLALPGAKP